MRFDRCNWPERLCAAQSIVVQMIALRLTFHRNVAAVSLVGRHHTLSHTVEANVLVARMPEIFTRENIATALLELTITSGSGRHNRGLCRSDVEIRRSRSCFQRWTGTGSRFFFVLGMSDSFLIKILFTREHALVACTRASIHAQPRMRTVSRAAVKELFPSVNPIRP